MAILAVIASKHVNGVAAIHSGGGGALAVLAGLRFNQCLQQALQLVAPPHLAHSASLAAQREQHLLLLAVLPAGRPGCRPRTWWQQQSRWQRSVGKCHRL